VNEDQGDTEMTEEDVEDTAGVGRCGDAMLPDVLEARDEIELVFHRRNRDVIE